jgi:hypothetical protein
MNDFIARTATLGFLLFALAGCTTTTRTRFEISPTENPSGASAEDRDAVRDVLAAVAPALRLKDFTATSIVPETIAFYQQADTTNPLKIIAWAEDSRIFVDLMQFPNQPGESLLYQRARDELTRELRERFGERSAIVNFRALERPVQSDAR